MYKIILFVLIIRTAVGTPAYLRSKTNTTELIAKTNVGTSQVRSPRLPVLPSIKDVYYILYADDNNDGNVKHIDDVEERAVDTEHMNGFGDNVNVRKAGVEISQQKDVKAVAKSNVEVNSNDGGKQDLEGKVKAVKINNVKNVKENEASSMQNDAKKELDRETGSENVKEEEIINNAQENISVKIAEDKHIKIESKIEKYVAGVSKINDNHEKYRSKKKLNDKLKSMLNAVKIKQKTDKPQEQDKNIKINSKTDDSLVGTELLKKHEIDIIKDGNKNKEMYKTDSSNLKIDPTDDNSEIVKQIGDKERKFNEMKLTPLIKGFDKFKTIIKAAKTNKKMDKTQKQDKINIKLEPKSNDSSVGAQLEAKRDIDIIKEGNRNIEMHKTESSNIKSDSFDVQIGDTERKFNEKKLTPLIKGFDKFKINAAKTNIEMDKTQERDNKNIKLEPKRNDSSVGAQVEAKRDIDIIKEGNRNIEMHKTESSNIKSDSFDVQIGDTERKFNEKKLTPLIKSFDKFKTIINAAKTNKKIDKTQKQDNKNINLEPKSKDSLVGVQLEAKHDIDIIKEGNENKEIHRTDNIKTDSFDESIGNDEKKPNGRKPMSLLKGFNKLKTMVNAAKIKQNKQEIAADTDPEDIEDSEYDFSIMFE